MKILSVDAGAVAMGISLWEDEKILKLGTVRLLPLNLDFGEFKRKYSGRTNALLVRNFLAFAKNSADWSPHFKNADKIIFEEQSLKFTHALTHGLNAWLFTINPNVDVLWVRPFDISRKYQIGGLGRAERKKRIRKIVFERLKMEDPGVGSIPQDPVDSILNIFYYLERRKKDTFLLPCPSWSCVSQNLTKPST